MNTYTYHTLLPDQKKQEESITYATISTNNGLMLVWHTTAQLCHHLNFFPNTIPYYSSSHNVVGYTYPQQLADIFLSCSSSLDLLDIKKQRNIWDHDPIYDSLIQFAQFLFPKEWNYKYYHEKVRERFASTIDMFVMTHDRDEIEIIITRLLINIKYNDKKMEQVLDNLADNSSFEYYLNKLSNLQKISYDYDQQDTDIILSIKKTYIAQKIDYLKYRDIVPNYQEYLELEALMIHAGEQEQYDIALLIQNYINRIPSS